MAFYYSFRDNNSTLLWVARIIVICIVISDFLDGYLARTFGQITTLGKFLDPLADKLFVTCSFILLAVFEKVPPWLTIIVVTKDLMLCLGWALRALLYDKIDIKPSLLGKSATGLQYLTVCILILFSFRQRIYPLELLTGIVTIAALVHYFYVSFQALANNGNHKERLEGRAIDS
jgi:cardiolipin synthase